MVAILEMTNSSLPGTIVYDTHQRRREDGADQA